MLSAQNAFLKDVTSLVNSIDQLGNSFKEDSGDLLSLDTKDIMPAEVVQSVKSAKKRDQNQYKDFVKERFVERTKPVTDPIKRNKIPLFSRASGLKVPLKKQSKVSELKEDCSLFSQLYIACQMRDGDLEDFFRHENKPSPPSLSRHGQLRQVDKSELIKCLASPTVTCTEIPAVGVKVFNGAVVVQMLNPKTARTFREYVQTVFLPYMYVNAQLLIESRIDLVCDTYREDSLKASAREK